ncbi:Cysteine proteinases superfamily protein [Trifolium repens]|nr:Cysteine proteinases superfamily protein [Trifolium repens]
MSHKLSKKEVCIDEGLSEFMEMEILNAIVYGSNCWSRAYILTLFANKKQGKQDDTAQFRTQLDALGLRIVEVTADGNCFFRALADQLEGNEEEHRKYRSMVVKHILETFEPFIEDEVPFDEYFQTMDNDGTWAGHMEVQAASLVTHSNVCIHRVGSR